MNDNPFVLLGLGELAVKCFPGNEVVEAAFRREALKWHPDKHAGSDESTKAKAAFEYERLNRARTIVLDEDLRSEWIATQHPHQKADVSRDAFSRRVSAAARRRAFFDDVKATHPNYQPTPFPSHIPTVVVVEDEPPSKRVDETVPPFQILIDSITSALDSVTTATTEVIHRTVRDTADWAAKRAEAVEHGSIAPRIAPHTNDWSSAVECGLFMFEWDPPIDADVSSGATSIGGSYSANLLRDVSVDTLLASLRSTQ